MQIDVPRDYFYGEGDFTILEPQQYRVSARGAGDEAALDRAAELLAPPRTRSSSSGPGVTESAAAGDVRQLAASSGRRSPPHTCTPTRTRARTSSPSGPSATRAPRRRWACSRRPTRPRLGTRLNGFGNLPQYGFDYFPKDAKIVQIDIDH